MVPAAIRRFLSHPVQIHGTCRYSTQCLLLLPREARLHRACGRHKPPIDRSCINARDITKHTPIQHICPLRHSMTRRAS